MINLCLLETELSNLIDSFDGRAPDELLTSARQEIGYGEYGLALENFAEQLFEHSLALTVEQHSKITDLAAAMSLPADSFTFLKPMIEHKA